MKDASTPTRHYQGKFLRSLLIDLPSRVMNLETRSKIIFRTAKKQKLKECMEDEDHCPNTFGPCNPEHTDQCIDLVGKGMSYKYLIFLYL